MANYISIYSLILLLLILPSISYMIQSKINSFLSIKALKTYMYVILFFEAFIISFFISFMFTLIFICKTLV